MKRVTKGSATPGADTGLDLIIYANSDTYGTHSDGWEKLHVTRLAGTLTDGCIIVTPWSEVRSSAPLVAIDPVRDSTIPSVRADNFAGAIAAVDHLLDLGHERVGFIAGRRSLAAAWAREEGYREALTRAGIAVDPALIGGGDFHPEAAIAPARELLALADRPTAIFAASDGMALKVLEVARELRLDVPKDLSIVGFDNVPESAMADPALTTIDQSMHQLGFEAARLLQALVSGTVDEESRQVFVPTRLIVRESTSPPHRGSDRPFGH